MISVRDRCGDGARRWVGGWVGGMWYVCVTIIPPCLVVAAGRVGMGRVGVRDGKDGSEGGRYQSVSGLSLHPLGSRCTVRV